MAEYFYKWFNDSAHVVIKSENPNDIYSHQDILCILINNFPLMNPYQVFVSSKRGDFAIVVGDNVNVKGTVKIWFEKNKFNKKFEWYKQCQIKTENIIEIKEVKNE